MKKYYLFYIALLMLLFSAVLVVWPTIPVTISLGSFHYEKVWSGPNLEDLSNDRFHRTFDLDLGLDFKDSSEYTLIVSHADAQPVTDTQLEQTLALLKKRVEDIGYKEHELRAQRSEGTTYITLTIPESVENFALYRDQLFNTGLFELWTQKEVPIETDPTLADGSFRTNLENNYDKIDINGNNVKAYKIGSRDGLITITVGLKDEESKRLSSQIGLLFGKQITGVLDESYLYIDSQDLSQQLQTYGVIRNLTFFGIFDQDQSYLSATLIKNGPLPVNLTLAESKPIGAGWGTDVLKDQIILSATVVNSIGVFLIIVFRKKALLPVFLLVFFFVLVLSLIKIVHMTFTVGVLMALIVGTVYFLLRLMVELANHYTSQEMHHIRINIDEKKIQMLREFDILSGIVLIFLTFLTPWPVKLVFGTLFVTWILQLLLLRMILPFMRKFPLIVR